MKLDKFCKLVGNQIFTVTFEKKDGTLRVMNARMGVRKYVKGTGTPINDGRVGCYDMKIGDGPKGYRSFWPDSVTELKVGGKIYDGEGNELKGVTT